MNRDDIIRMAREARLAEPYHPFNPWSASQEALERFAALVAAEVSKCEGCGKPHALYCLKCCEESIVQTAVKEEREACARLCDEFGFVWPSVAVAIRARGEK